MGLSAVYTEAGDPAEVVKLIDVDEPRDPGPGQVLVRVTLFPITGAICRPSNRLHRPGG
jgi:NADPH:quinone reductase-like Zn-dependent oxidoreductase